MTEPSFEQLCPTHKEMATHYCTLCMQFRCYMCEDKHGNTAMLNGAQIYNAINTIQQQQQCSHYINTLSTLLISFETIASQIKAKLNQKITDLQSQCNFNDEKNIFTHIPDSSFNIIKALSDRKLKHSQLYSNKAQSVSNDIGKMIKSISKLNDSGSNIVLNNELTSRSLKISNIGNIANIKPMESDLQFDVSHTHSDMNIFNNGKSVKRIKGGGANVNIYGNICITSGIAVWKIKVVKKNGHIGVGIHTNNTDVQCYSHHFLFSNGEIYGMANASTYNEGDVLYCKVDMNAKEFSIRTPTSTATCKLNQSQYYPCFELQGNESEIMITDAFYIP